MVIELGGGRTIGPGHPCFIIAEAGVNHNGDIALAKQLIDVAVHAQADAVKFQSFRTEQLVTPTAPKARYQAADGREESQFAMLRRLELSATAHRELRDYCQMQGIMFLSTPFEETSADLLEALGVPAFKIPSGELTNWPFLQHLARKGKPLILSTGMSSLREVEDAVRIIHQTSNTPLVLLHCVSSYPADPADANLRAMQMMGATFQVPVGFSDHTPGITVALAAVALGACVIEKHFTLHRALPGPDHRASLEPRELAALVHGIRTVEAALGHGRKEPVASEAETAAVARKSLVAARMIPAGSHITVEAIAVKRPGTGLAPAMADQIVGRRAAQDIPEGAVLRLEMMA